MFPYDMNTTHSLRRFHRCLAAIRAAFANVDNVVVPGDAKWLVPLLLIVFDSEWAFSFEMPTLVAVMT